MQGCRGGSRPVCRLPPRRTLLPVFCGQSWREAQLPARFLGATVPSHQTLPPPSHPSVPRDGPSASLPQAPSLTPPLPGAAGTNTHNLRGFKQQKLSLSHFRRLQVQNQGVSRLVLHGGSEAESIQAPLLDSGGCLQSLALLGLHMHHPILCFTHHPPVSVSFLLFLEGHQSYRIKRPPSSSMISS